MGAFSLIVVINLLNSLMKQKAEVLFSRILSKERPCDGVLAHGETCLHVACREGNERIVELLLSSYKSKALNIKDDDGKCPIHEAVIHNNIGCVRLLLAHHSPIDPLKRSDWTPLMHSCENGNVQIFILLIENGADINLANKDGWSCLHLAARNGSFEIVNRLVNMSTELCRFVTTNGRTALHCAALHNKLQICAFFLESSLIDLNIEDACGTTAVLDAVKTDSPEMIELFRKYGADFDHFDKNGHNSVHIACQANCSKSLLMLTKIGCQLDVCSKNAASYNASHIAVTSNSLDCIKMILDYKAALFETENNHSITALKLVNGESSLNLLRDIFPSVKMTQTQNRYNLNALL